MKYIIRRKKFEHGFCVICSVVCNNNCSKVCPVDCIVNGSGVDGEQTEE